jgi:hypothetical protein
MVPNVNFNVKIHNEDYHYSHLMAGFIKTSDNTSLPLALVNNSNLEPLLFSDLFPDGKGHYHDNGTSDLGLMRKETYSNILNNEYLILNHVLDFILNG